MGKLIELPKSKSAQQLLISKIQIKEDQDSVMVIFDEFDNTGNLKPKSVALRMHKGTRIELFEKIEDLTSADVEVKVAFVKGEKPSSTRIFTRHSNVWSDKMEGGFVEWTKSFVSKFARMGPNMVVAGDTTINGYVFMDGKEILENKGEIIGLDPTLEEICRMGFLRK
jgi:hypothetical protein